MVGVEAQEDAEAADLAGRLIYLMGYKNEAKTPFQNESNSRDCVSL